MKHTQDKLHVTGMVYLTPTCTNTIVIATTIHKYGLPHEQQHANAKRLALCWNNHDDLLNTCELVMKVKDYLLPKGALIKEEHIDEVQALLKMFNSVEEAIAKVNKEQ